MNPQQYITERIDVYVVRGDEFLPNGPYISTADVGTQMGYMLRIEASHLSLDIRAGKLSPTEIGLKHVKLQTLLDLADKVDPIHARDSGEILAHFRVGA
jgi:hypothetical protein